MAGRIIIDIERCKGCGLCITVCPKNGIAISKKSNKSGYFPAQPVPSAVEGVEGTSNSDCAGCAMCALICPDVAIEVYCDDPGKDEIVSQQGRKTKPRLVKEKT
jgi:2-oxoglutarate ferredoxin oxidoreductase subunit delta